jgi:mannose-6-phosphate isomerase-like protein (cupin superfamily)
MPVFRSGKGLAPAWCELEFFEIVALDVGSTHTFERMGEREKVIMAEGECAISLGDAPIEAERGAGYDIAEGGAFVVSDVRQPTTLVRMCGRWGSEVGGSGLFPAFEEDDPNDGGDPVDYPKRTGFDNHFHDCDEYWIVVRGKGVAVSEGKAFEVGPGDCVATGMGWHHDFPTVAEPVLAVFFETTMGGQKRPGHLWEHTHGPAEPQPERI